MQGSRREDPAVAAATGGGEGERLRAVRGGAEARAGRGRRDAPPHTLRPRARGRTARAAGSPCWARAAAGGPCRRQTCRCCPAPPPRGLPAARPWAAAAAAAGWGAGWAAQGTPAPVPLLPALPSARDPEAAWLLLIRPPTKPQTPRHWAECPRDCGCGLRALHHREPLGRHLRRSVNGAGQEGAKLGEVVGGLLCHVLCQPHPCRVTRESYACDPQLGAPGSRTGCVCKCCANTSSRAPDGTARRAVRPPPPARRHVSFIFCDSVSSVFTVYLGGGGKKQGGK